MGQSWTVKNIGRRIDFFNQGVVVWGVSDTALNGWGKPFTASLGTPGGTNPRAIVSYPTSEPASVRKNINDLLVGGNCYWTNEVTGTTKGRILSFEGPWGFHISPQTLHLSPSTTIGTNSTVVAMKEFGYWTGVTPIPPSTLVTPNNLALNAITFSRFNHCITEKGKVIALVPGYTLESRWSIIGSSLKFTGTSPPVGGLFPTLINHAGTLSDPVTGHVLGCGIIGENTLLAIVNVNSSTDRVLSAQLGHGLILDWVTVGDIVYPNSSTITYLHRVNVYSFNSNGTAAITTTDIYDKAKLFNASVNFKVTVRLNFSTSSGVVLMGTPSFTTEAPLTRISSSNTSTTAVNMVQLYGGVLGSGTATSNTTSSTTESPGTVTSQVVASGFKGMVEQLLTLDAVSYSSTENSSSGLSFTNTSTSSAGSPYTTTGTLQETDPYYAGVSSGGRKLSSQYTASMLNVDVSTVTSASVNFQVKLKINGVDVNNAVITRVITASGNYSDHAESFLRVNTRALTPSTDNPEVAPVNTQTNSWNKSSSSSSNEEIKSTLRCLHLDLNVGTCIFIYEKSLVVSSGTTSGSNSSASSTTFTGTYSDTSSYSSDIYRLYYYKYSFNSEHTSSTLSTSSSTTNYDLSIQGYPTGSSSTSSGPTESYITNTNVATPLITSSGSPTSLFAFCKGSHDFHGNFIGEILYNYPTLNTSTMNTKIQVCLPDGDTCSTLLGSTGSNQDLSGSKWPSTNVSTGTSARSPGTSPTTYAVNNPQRKIFKV